MKKMNLSFSRLFFLVTFFTREVCGQERFFVPKSIPKASYKIDAHLDLTKKIITGNEVIKFRNDSSRTIAVIAIDSRREIKINIKGKPLQLLNNEKDRHRKSPFFYKLPKPVKPGKTLELDIEFSNEVGTDEKPNEVRLRKWHPILWWNNIPSQNSFKVKINTPADYHMAISGRLNEKTGYYENDSVATTFGIYLSKNVKVEQRDVEGVLVTSLFTKKGQECAKLLLETAADVIKFYKDFHGFYPFEFLYIIPGASRPMGGCPYASGIVIVHGQEQYKEKPPIHWKWIMAHEIGHQYWGEYVIQKGVTDGCYPWLVLGMGLYLDREYVKSRGLGMDKQKEIMDRYLEGVKEHYDTTLDAPPSLVKKQKYDRNNVLEHGKSLSVFSALEAVLGKEGFKKAYLECAKKYGGRRLGYRDVQRIFEEESDENLEWFFDQWVRSNKYLYYAIESFKSVENGKKFLSSVKITRGFPSLTIAMPIPVQAIFEDGSSQIEYTNRHLEVNVVEFESRSKLKEVILDPANQLAMLNEPLEMTSEEAAEIASEAISDLAAIGSGPKALKLFKQFGQDITLSARRWLDFALKLFDGKYYKEAFEACKKGIEKKVPKAHAAMVKFIYMTWMGHLKDLMNERSEAIQYYKEALRQDIPEGFSMDFDPYNITIDRNWVEKRLKIPFIRK